MFVKNPSADYYWTNCTYIPVPSLFLTPCRFEIYILLIFFLGPAMLLASDLLAFLLHFSPTFNMNVKKLSRDMTKPTKRVCAQRRLRSAWASGQSDQSLRRPHEESLGP